MRPQRGTIPHTTAATCTITTCLNFSPIVLHSSQPDIAGSKVWRTCSFKDPILSKRPHGLPVLFEG